MAAPKNHSRYTLSHLIGKGAFGLVFKAWDHEDQRWVAVKHLKGCEGRHRVLRELQYAHRFEHPNIIKLLDAVACEDASTLFLVMELMDGGDLHSLIKQHATHAGSKMLPYTMPKAIVQVVMYQLLLALKHMHASGVVHMDVKPENVLLKGNRVVLADLGTTRPVGKPASSCGTDEYMAPEVADAEADEQQRLASPAADMWGAGCVMAELLAGRTLEQLVTRTASCKDMVEAEPDAWNLVCMLLDHCPQGRILAEEALRHPFFNDMSPRHMDTNAESLSPNAALSRREDESERTWHRYTMTEIATHHADKHSSTEHASLTLQTRAIMKLPANRGLAATVVRKEMRRVLHVWQEVPY